MTSSSVLGPLRRPPFRRLVAAQFVAEIGDGITLVALPLYVYARTQSELLTSLTFAAELGLGVVLALVGGVLADTFNRRHVLLVSYVVRATLLALAYLVDPLALVIGFGVLARALGQADNPSFDAIVPGMAEGDLQAVVAIRRMIQAVAFTIGPAAGALAVVAVGAQSSLLLNSAAFVVAFGLLRSAKGIDAQSVQRKLAREGHSFRASMAEIIGGMGIVTRTPGVRRLLPYQAATMGVVGLLMASAVVYYERDLNASGSWFGLAIAAYGLGNAAGLGLAGSRHLSLPLPRMALIGAPIYAVLCAVGAAVSEVWILPLSWLLWGMAFGPEMVRSETFFVSRIPEAQHGRAFAGLGVATTLGMATGFAVSGPLLEQLDARWVILGSGGVTLLLGLVWVGPALQGDDWPGTRPISYSSSGESNDERSGGTSTA